MTDLAVSCPCGSVKGTLRGVSPSTVQHLVCHCVDCRTAVRHLGRDELLTEHGGVQIVQASPARLTIEAGHSHIALLRLSPKGLLRWYSSCCNTPLANMVDHDKLPFVGVPRVNLPADADAHLGPSSGIQGAQATTEASKLPAHVHNTLPVGLQVKTAWRLGAAWLRGEARPSPFHNEDGSFIVAATVLTKQERAAAAG